jgi:lipid II:glycine glycyltransferase (peptidoglycan interpeptide bridge formation enzyme)
MEIKIIDKQETWDGWLRENKSQSFLQSWHWGEMLVRAGQKVERVATVDNGQIMAVAQVIIKNLPLKKQYVFCPKGPVISPDFQTRQSEILERFARYFRERGFIFWRLEPEFEWADTQQKIQNTNDINPRATLLLNIDLPEEKLLGNLHSKTRYNLHLAQRKELRVSYDKNFGVFWELLKKTGARDNFILHSKESYENIMTDTAISQITIYHQDRAIASGGFIGFGDTFVYLYGALDYEARHLMGPYLLQWSAIMLGKKLGYKYYDFFGVAPIKREKNIDNQILSIPSAEF